MKIIKSFTRRFGVAAAFALVWGLANPAQPRLFRRADSDPPSAIKVVEAKGVSLAPLRFSGVTDTWDLPDGPGQGETRHLGSWTLTDPLFADGGGDNRAFILKVSFKDGRESLKNLSKRFEEYIGIESVELRYRDAGEAPVVRPLSSGMFNSEDGVYEVRFEKEDLQAFYEVEVWATVSATDLRRAAAGRYECVLEFSVEVLP